MITDLNLPDGDGLELIEHCRHNHPNTAIVVQTGYPDEKRIRDMMALDINTFLIKPFTIQQLKYAVLRALEERKVRIEANGSFDVEDTEEDVLGLVGISSYIKKHLTPEKKENIPGATGSDGTTITAFKMTVDEMERYIQRHPGCTLKEMFSKIDHHYSSFSSARNSTYQWIRRGVVKNIYIE